jgi:hypothetical protein
MDLDTSVKVSIHEALHLVGLGHCENNNRMCIMISGKSLGPGRANERFKQVQKIVCNGEHRLR